MTVLILLYVIKAILIAKKHFHFLPPPENKKTAWNTQVSAIVVGRQGAQTFFSGSVTAIYLRIFFFPTPLCAGRPLGPGSRGDYIYIISTTPNMQTYRSSVLYHYPSPQLKHGTSRRDGETCQTSDVGSLYGAGCAMYSERKLPQVSRTYRQTGVFEAHQPKHRNQE